MPKGDVLEGLVARSSNRLRWAMAATALLCLLIGAGILSDRGVWQSGWGWRVVGVLGVAFFVGMAGLLVWGAFWRQKRHIAKLRRILRTEPQRIRSIRLLVAQATPVASWTLDDGRHATGLHVFVTDDTGATWVLPVSRSESASAVVRLAQRCPQATVEP